MICTDTLSEESQYVLALRHMFKAGIAIFPNGNCICMSETQKLQSLISYVPKATALVQITAAAAAEGPTGIRTPRTRQPGRRA